MVDQEPKKIGKLPPTVKSVPGGLSVDVAEGSDLQQPDLPQPKQKKKEKQIQGDGGYIWSK